jgi:FKBP-type peptidyl-prolyl cis-trans isomerase
MDATVGVEENRTKQGTGAEAVAGKPVVVHYTGWFTTGAARRQRQEARQLLDRSEPFSFRWAAAA